METSTAMLHLVTGINNKVGGKTYKRMDGKKAII